MGVGLHFCLWAPDYSDKIGKPGRDMILLRHHDMPSLGEFGPCALCVLFVEDTKTHSS